MLRARPFDDSLSELLSKSHSKRALVPPSPASTSTARTTATNTAPKTTTATNSTSSNQKATIPLKDASQAPSPPPAATAARPLLGTRKTSSINTTFSKTISAAKVGQTVKKGVGVAGKGTVKATQMAGKGATLLGAKMATGAVGAVSYLPQTAVGAVTNLPGNAIHLAEHTVKGINNLAARKLLLRRVEIEAAAAWKTRLTSPITKIELELECKHLRRKDAFAECDAFCVVWQVPSGYGSDGTIGKVAGEESFSSLGASAGGASLMSITSSSNNARKKRPRVHPLPTSTEKELGRTEVVKGNRHPHFSHRFVIDFKFQEEQTYVVRVYDRDLEFCPDLKEHDFLGGTIFTMGELMGVGRRELRRPLRSHAAGGGGGSHTKSVLTIRGNEVSSTRSVLEFRFSAQGLRENDKAVLDKDDDPYFQILKLNQEDQSWQPVYKSEVLMHNNSPTWARARLPLPVICNDDMRNPLKITFWDWRRSEQSEPLGYVETTVQGLVEGAERGIPVLDVRRETKRFFRRDKVKKSGQLKVLRAELQPVPTMLEYICGGCQIDLMVAVDCSIHNGDATVEGGLHHRPAAMWLNDYQAAMNKVGAIMEPYAPNDKEFTIWGFGGDIRGETVSLFPMGGDDGVVHGASGLLDAYDTTFIDNPLYMEPAEHDPIAPLIQSAMYRAIKKSEREHCYSVLCILTAGNIGSDLRDTIDTICTAAEDAPLSIVIIGVGDNEEGFATIRTVLANGGKLRHSNGVPIGRDIVGFASFNEFDGNAGQVVAESLKDLPEQFVEYFTDNGILPRPPQTRHHHEDVSMQDESLQHSVGGSRRSRGTRRRSKSPKKNAKVPASGRRTRSLPKDRD